MWMDHGLLRIWWHNFAKLDDHSYRSNQPSPDRLAQYKSLGIKSILNLRGPSKYSQYLFEQEACTKLGLELVDHSFSASRLPTAQAIFELERTFLTIEKPFLLHCKSGADRAGFASALYLMLIKELPVHEARKQLNVKHLHLKFTSTGILDYFFDEYAVANRGEPISLRDWLTTHYDPAVVTSRFNSGKPALLERAT